MSDDKLSPAALLVLERLEALSLTELNRIELYHLRRIKRKVAMRTALECVEKVAAERGLSVAMVVPHVRAVSPGELVCAVEWTPALEAEARAQNGPQVALAIVPDDEDDEPMEPTPLEEVTPITVE